MLRIMLEIILLWNDQVLLNTRVRFESSLFEFEIEFSLNKSETSSTQANLIFNSIIRVKYFQVLVRVRVF